MRVAPPRVSATWRFGSVVPETAVEAFSLALMTSLPATTAIVGRSGAIVSTVIARVAAAEVLPAPSRAVADSVSGPWPIAAMSAAVSV